MIPRERRWESGTRAGVLRCNVVEVGAKPGQVDAWRTTEHGDGAVDAHETVPPERGQLTNGYAVSGDDVALALVQSLHDRATLVPKLPLGDVSGHDAIVARRATSSMCDQPGRPGRAERHRPEGRG